MFGDLNEKEKKKADVNKDNNISIQEAFKYTAKNDFYTNFYLIPLGHKNTYHLYSKKVDPSKITLDNNRYLAKRK